MKSVITCSDLTFGYDDQPVLRNVELAVPDGDFACIVGPNGSGKTTLLKLALGLLTPQRGSIRVFGSSPAAARGRIGYVPQHPRLDPLFPVNALDVVLMGRLNRGSAWGSWRRDDLGRL